MSDPTLTYEDKIQGALNELVSAISALNMPPEPIENVEPNEYRPLYLSETDGMVQHAMEHISATLKLLDEAHRERESLKMQVYRLVIQLTEVGLVPKVKNWLDED